MVKSIIVIEDDKPLRDYLKDILIDEGYVVEVEGDGLSAMKKLGAFMPDLVILDLGLPNLDGESLCQRIKKESPNSKIIILTGRSSNQDIVKGLELGADDYITKPFETDVFLARVHARLREETSEKNLKISDLILNKDSHEVTRDGKLIELTPKEFSLLEYLMINTQRVLTRDMILNRIWRGNNDVESRVVDIYIGFLRKKIDANYTKKLIKSIRGFGYQIKE